MYKLKFHKGLAERWAQFPVHKQLLMLSNELNRAKNMFARNDSKEAENALERAFEILDLMICECRNSLRYELLRFRELFAERYLKGFSADECARFIRVVLSLNGESYNSVVMP